MASDIETKVREKISEQLGVAADEVKPESSFIEDLGADSLDIVELVMALEEEFNIGIFRRRRREDSHGQGRRHLYRGAQELNHRPPARFPDAAAESAPAFRGGRTIAAR